MAEVESPICAECEGAFSYPEIDRRDFLRATAGAAAGALALGSGVAEAVAPPRRPRPAEDLVRELHHSLTAEQKRRVVLPYDHGAGRNRRPTRLGMFNAAALNVRIEDVYTPAQTELIDRIVKSMSSGDDGYRQISRLGRWDASGKLERCGALIFGDPLSQGTTPFAFLFSGHHLTIRCDGDTAPGTAFGGPIYYGHSPNGWSRGNVFNYQTRSVVRVFQALDGKQREKALVKRGNPGEMEGSIRFQDDPARRPGLAASDLTRDQKALVERVMRDVLSPYRREDVDEVMDIVRRNGGMDRIRLAFYEDGKTGPDEPWSFWRLEGPGFVWNYRVLEHVHTYVNIATRPAPAPAPKG